MKRLAFALIALSASLGYAETPYDFSKLEGRYGGSCTLVNEAEGKTVKQEGIVIDLFASETSLRSKTIDKGKVASIEAFSDVSFTNINQGKDVKRDCAGWFIGHTSIFEKKASTVENGLHGVSKAKSCFIRQTKWTYVYELQETKTGFSFQAEGTYLGKLNCTFERSLD